MKKKSSRKKISESESESESEKKIIIINCKIKLIAMLLHGNWKANVRSGIYNSRLKEWAKQRKKIILLWTIVSYCEDLIIKKKSKTKQKMSALQNFLLPLTTFFYLWILNYLRFSFCHWERKEVLTKRTYGMNSWRRELLIFCVI